MELETLISDLRNLAAQYEALDSRNEYDRGFHLGAATLARACADKLTQLATAQAARDAAARARVSKD